MVIHAARPADFELVEAESMTRGEVDELLAREAARPFDLSQDPLARVRVVTRSGGDQIVLLVVHHLIADGWSLGLISREWAHLYSRHVAGNRRVEPAPPLQFADFAVAQTEWLAEGVTARQLEFWRRHLEGAPPEAERPLDTSPAPGSSEAASVHRFDLTSAQLHGVTRLARDAGATTHMVLLAAFAALLHRLSGQERVVVGTPVANRPHPATEEMLGFFVNTLPLCVSFERGGSFTDLLARVRDVALAAQSNQDVPFHEIVEAINPSRHPGRNPLFQVSFVWQNTPQPTPRTRRPGRRAGRRPSRKRQGRPDARDGGDGRRDRGELRIP